MDISKLVSVALPIIFSNEGNYGSVNKDDNGAVSIGKIQWHGNRALNLLKRIVKADRTEAISRLGQDLYYEIVRSNNWSRRIVSKTEAMDISYLLSTAKAKAIQDQQAVDDVTAYIKAGMKFMKDGKALIYFADIYNQSPAAAVRIGKKVKKASLDTIHACALNDEVIHNYSARRYKVYNKLIELSLYDKPVKTITPHSSENDIKWLQDKLKIEADGIYGEQTRNAVRAFYKAQKWKSDGEKVGVYGIARLNKC
jgi:lysozyme family protein